MKDYMYIKLIIVFLCFTGCSKFDKKGYKTYFKEELIGTDISMSLLAAKIGFNSSILQYSDANIVKLSEGRVPIIGKTAFASSFNKESDLKTISWHPIDAEVAKSGDLGYTWGNWQYIAKDTIFYGNYFTVWKKDIHKQWKVVLDGGNNTPEPPNEKNL
ncbi:MAG: hypothetical protein CO117_05820 [Flavobacteriaceae bacterium CG_4_9_14_3_um_filter_33_16]|nr:MAG: hypothetical protein CO117_05820 [Flavobacteriaceae bacterium CG_4_9_14_3_um_filter_33_16]